jgi:peptidoglycan/LPS O-acetylase OafA/YrhL
MLANIADKFRRITTNNLYLAEIDGMRFLSLMLVTLFHIRGYFLEKTQVVFADKVSDHHWLNTFFFNSDRSVPLFFAISGMILSMPFAHHYLNHGKKTDLKLYYLRRVTRLEPPYFIVMICIFLAQIYIMHNYTFRQLLPSLLASLVYSHNAIYHHAPLVTVVAWTLEIEIQFYIVAPFLFRVLALPKVTRRLIVTAGIIALVLLQNWFPPTFQSLYSCGQHFLIGILISDLYVSGFAIDRFRSWWMAPAAILLFLIMFLMPRWEGVPYCTDYRILLGILFPFMIGLLYYMVLRNKWVKSAFSYKFIPIIGGMCYTTYLLHYTVISMLGRFTIKAHLTNYYIPNMLLQFVLLCIPILLISSVFYLYVEKPFMSKKWIDKLVKKDKHLSVTNMQSELPAPATPEKTVDNS